MAESKTDRVTLIKGKLKREISAKEYRLIKDDLNGWEVERKAPPVPVEVAEAVEQKTKTAKRSKK